MITVTWTCPICGDRNSDLFDETAFPYCECGKDFDWREVLDDQEFEDANERLKAEQNYPTHESIKSEAEFQAQTCEINSHYGLRDASLDALINTYSIGDDYVIDFEDQCYFRRMYEEFAAKRLGAPVPEID